MEKRSILTLSAMQTMAGRAIRDIKAGGRRETRNILALCRSYARRPQQKEFWSVVKDSLLADGNQYEALIHRAASSVREDSLKALAIGLSCTTFSSGRELLCREAASGQENCWIQRLLPSADMQEEVTAWTQKGVSVFLADLSELKGCGAQLAELPARNSRCIFIYIVQDADQCPSCAARAPEAGNICILLSPQSVDAYGPRLREQKLFFGVIRGYEDIRDLQEEQALRRRWIDAGCLIGVYRSPRQSLPQPREEELYRELVEIRCRGQLELFLWDLERDTAVVQDVLMGRRKVPDGSHIHRGSGAYTDT